MDGDDLQADDADERQPELAVGEELPVEGAAKLGPGIEDVEELEQDEGGECQRHRMGVAAAIAQSFVVAPGVGRQRARRHRQAVECQTPEPRAGEDVRIGCARRCLHDAGSRRLDTEGHGRRAVHDDVDPEDLNRGEGRRHAEQRRGEHGDDGADIGGKLEADKLDDVVVDGASFLDSAHDGGEVVVGEHQGCGLLRDRGAGDAHGDADVGGFQRRGIIDAVAGHRDDMAARLQGLDDAQLVFGRDAGEDGGALGHRTRRRAVESFNFAALARFACQTEF
ncbi:MAG: hypothetical protein AW07_04610 [Candidatus Accumulibacter sp. SK-11]|nr:MAG: hypothetical protein AW07_04610 [Candidatus Accumulibacter sp. SK-11]